MSRQTVFIGLMLAMYAGPMMAQTATGPVSANQARMTSTPAADKAAASVPAAPNANDKNQQQEMRLTQAILQLQEGMRQRDAIIRNLLERVKELETEMNGGTATSRSATGTAPDQTAPSTTPPALAGGGTGVVVPRKDITPPSTTAANASTSTSLTTATAAVENAGYDAAERHASETLDQMLLLQGGLLLPSGTLEVDNTVSYFGASSENVAINGFALLPVLVVGDITSQRVRNDFLIPTFTTLLGLPKNFQMDFTIPYGYQLQRTVGADGTQSSTSAFGLGDMQVGLSKQLTFEHGRVPDLLANARFKSRTGADAFNVGTSNETTLGTGFYGLQGNLTAVKTNDPLVFFGNLQYTENFAADHTVSANDPNNPSATMVGHFNPGSEAGFQLGSVLAINPDTSFIMGWDQRFTRATQLNGVDVPASYLVEGTLRLGTSYLIAPGRTVDVNFGVGLTPDTPNLQFSVGLPFKVGLWNRHKRQVTK